MARITKKQKLHNSVSVAVARMVVMSEFSARLQSGRKVEKTIKTKADKARQIFAELTATNTRRCDIIRAFMAQLDMNHGGASTYYQNIVAANRKVGQAQPQ